MTVCDNLLSKVGWLSELVLKPGCGFCSVPEIQYERGCCITPKGSTMYRKLLWEGICLMQKMQAVYDGSAVYDFLPYSGLYFRQRVRMCIQKHSG